MLNCNTILSRECSLNGGNRCRRVNCNKSKRYVKAGIVAAMAWQLPSPGLASDSITVSAVTRYEYNSNIFALQNGAPIPGTSDYQHWDSMYTYGAALDASYLWSQQKLFAVMSINEFRYDHFTELDHREYSIDAGLNWKLGLKVDGTLEALRSETMVPFSSVQFASFILQTEQREVVKIGWEFVPDWRIEGGGRYRTIDQTSAETPDINLAESYGQLALKYLGRAGLIAGLSGGYTVGNYSGPGASSDPSYRQSNVDLVASYEPTGRSSFNGALGYSDRTSASSYNAISGFTGELDYTYQLTGKTSLQMRLARTINSYVANSSSEIDTVAGMTAHWQATYLLSVDVSYAWTTRNLPGQGDAPPGSDRVDHDQLASIKIVYEPFLWLSIKPYVTLETRSSNYTGEDVVGANFNATVYGVYFTVHWQNQPKKN
jgi:hypothetical protein